MEAGKFSFKFSRQTQKNLVGSSKYAYFRCSTKFEKIYTKFGGRETNEHMMASLIANVSCLSYAMHVNLSSNIVTVVILCISQQQHLQSITLRYITLH
jgi:hypothetical protein